MVHESPSATEMMLWENVATLLRCLWMMKSTYRASFRPIAHVLFIA